MRTVSSEQRQFNTPSAGRPDHLVRFAKFKKQIPFTLLKIVTIVVSAMIPLASGMNSDAIFVGSLGIVVVVSEGIQQLFQFQNNWISYRSTAEYLKHEKYLHTASAGPYDGCENANKLLAERIESLVSQEHAKWVSTHQAEKPKKNS